MIYLLVFPNVCFHNNHLGINKQYAHNFPVIKVEVLLFSAGNRIYISVSSLEPSLTMISLVQVIGYIFLYRH